MKEPADQHQNRARAKLQRLLTLLGATDFDGWLDGSLGPDALRPAAEQALREWIVSSRVNRTGIGDDDPTLAEAVAEVA